VHMAQVSAAVAFVGVLLAGVSGVHASEALKAIVGSYLEIQAQLSSDKIDGLKAPATAIAAKAAEMGASGADIAKAAKVLAGASDLKSARDAFGPLSDAVITAAKAEGWKDLGDAKLAYCPMVKQSWLQKGDVIRNPYYGSGMLTCGEFKKP